MGIKEARITIGDVDETVAIDTDAFAAKFQVTLPRGPTMLQSWLTRPDGKQHGAYYARIRHLETTQQIDD
jgi:hypothetical protein